MILTKWCVLRSSLLRKYLAQHITFSTVSLRIQEYSNTSYSNAVQQHYKTKYQNLLPLYILHRKWYSQRSPDVSEYSDLELKKIRSLFPEPRMTLNNLSAKTPEKVFEVHYKQYVAPKGFKKKNPQNLDWTCTYTFVWPEKMKFECTALSKRQAGEAAATQALHWLTINKRIDIKGNLIYDRDTISKVRSTLHEPIHARIGENSVERIDRIWEDYESGIKQIYEKTAKEAKNRVITASAHLAKDSTLDEVEFPGSENGSSEEIDNFTEQKGPIHPVYGRILRPPSEQALKKKRQALKQKFQYYDESLTPLPIDEYSNQITSTLENSKVTVLVGAAGCGKSTRVPAMILRACNVDATVVVAEPRRVAAIGLAERVASEMGEEVGESIGYHVRLNSKPPRPPAGSVLFCTSGVLLNRLQTNPGLSGCSHVIIDEAHERDVNTDITLLLLKRALDINPGLKIVIMSATLDIGVFTRYFEDCPVVEVPGRTFPVEVSYLEDIEKKFNIQLPNTLANCKKQDSKPQLNVVEIVETIKAIDKHEPEGAILVFLPGWAEIKHAKQLLDDFYGQSGIHMILPVHSRLSTTDQSKMFGIPPPGIRKIVLATNVAETSVTIPDVLYVIDAGAHKETTIREGTGTASLETVWVSLAGAKQRCGRAGRVQPGHCYRLYTKEKEAEFDLHTTPEILRVPLEQTVLDCKAYAPDDKAQDFLSQLPEPPSEKAVKFAVNDLIDIGALTPKEQLTRLGKALSTLQLSPRVGLSLVHASIVGTAVTTSNIAAHSDIEVFLNAADRREEIREIKRKFSQSSDHAALNRLQQEFEEKSRNTNLRGIDNWCQNYQLKKERLGFVQSLSSLYLSQLLRTGLIEPNLELEEMNRFSHIDELSIATLLSGVNGLLITRRNVRTKGKMRTVNEVFSSTGDRAHIASESVNHAITKRNKSCLVVHTGGRHSTERRALLVYRSSVVNAHIPLLFCRGDLVKKHSDCDEEITVLSLPKHKLDIHVPTSQSDTIIKTREMLWKTYQYYIDRDIRNLDFEEYSTVSRFKIRLVKAICKILVEAQRDCFEGSH